ncbi:MAG: hypothetical protein BWY74_00784 [Firmicutes bacterium ADurb.Bin419]|nr:MAG: hypothetical protein BWY74_00784 [Firmicutes bacterium ADurb.Bin419]
MVKIYLCPFCKKPISKNAKQCKSCSNRNRDITDAMREKCRIKKMGSKNPAWKGCDVGYFRMHAWVRKNKQKPKICPMCNKRKPAEIACMKEKCKRDVGDYIWLCVSCHRTIDWRINKLRQKSL